MTQHTLDDTTDDDSTDTDDRAETVTGYATLGDEREGRSMTFTPYNADEGPHP